MTQLTIRKVDEAWVSLAKDEASRRGVSMNTVFVEALKRGLGVAGDKPTNGLEKFAGRLPADEEMDRILDQDLRTIHPDDWQ